MRLDLVALAVGLILILAFDGLLSAARAALNRVPNQAPAVHPAAPAAKAAPMEMSAAGEILRKADLAAVYGGNKAAARLYQKALEQDPENARARFGLALALADQGQFAKALEHVNKALEKEPKNANYLYGRARIHLLSGNKDAAMADFTLAAQAGSHDAQDWLARTQAGTVHRNR